MFKSVINREKKMTQKKIMVNSHPVVEMYAKEHLNGDMDRREFISRATALGVTAAGAYGLIGASTPVLAGGHLQQGGTMRMAMECIALKDPRVFDWTQLAHFTAGTLEYLVEYNNDGSITPNLLEGWSANADATKYTCLLYTSPSPRDQRGSRMPSSG